MRIWMLWLTIVAALGADDVRAQAASEEQVKSAFVFNFAKLLTWPDASFESDAAPFRICTLGSDPSGRWLAAALEGKKAGARALEHSVIEVDQSEGCHLVYLGSAMEKRLVELTTQLSGQGVLLVDEGPEFAWPNGMIRLFQEDGRFRFEMNLAAFETAGLRVDPRMIRLARIASR